MSRKDRSLWLSPLLQPTEGIRVTLDAMEADVCGWTFDCPDVLSCGISGLMGTPAKKAGSRACAQFILLQTEAQDTRRLSYGIADLLNTDSLHSIAHSLQWFSNCVPRPEPRAVHQSAGYKRNLGPTQTYGIGSSEVEPLQDSNA